jgi:hypothetical protein
LIQGRIFGIDKNGMGTIVQTTHERDDQKRDDNCACNSLHRPVIVYAEFSLRSCFRCNTQIFQK